MDEGALEECEKSFILKKIVYKYTAWLQTSLG
jgi:hypothetical protein